MARLKRKGWNTPEGSGGRARYKARGHVACRHTIFGDQSPDLGTDFTLASPLSNVSDWVDSSLRGDKRWRYRALQASSGRAAWMQRISRET